MSNGINRAPLWATFAIEPEFVTVDVFVHREAAAQAAFSLARSRIAEIDEEAIHYLPEDWEGLLAALSDEAPLAHMRPALGREGDLVGAAMPEAMVAVMECWPEPDAPGERPSLSFWLDLSPKDLRLLGAGLTLLREKMALAEALSAEVLQYFEDKCAEDLKMRELDYLISRITEIVGCSTELPSAPSGSASSPSSWSSPPSSGRV